MPTFKIKKHNAVVGIIFFIGIAIMIGSLLTIMLMTPAAKKTASSNSAASNEIAIDVRNMDMGGEFTLSDTANNEVTLQNLQGQFTLLYFGFTHCPDICPASLVEMIGALEEFERLNGGKDKLQLVFVSVDPKRDTAAELHKYFENFDSRIMALTGTQEQIADIAKKYKVYYSVAVDGKETTSDYLINHSSFLYLLDKNGKLIKYYTPGATGHDIAKDIAASSN